MILSLPSSNRLRGVGRNAIDLPVAGFAAVALAFLAFAMPGDLLTELVGASGLPSILSAAEPPLGYKARVGVGLIGAALVFGPSSLCCAFSTELAMSERSTSPRRRASAAAKPIPMRPPAPNPPPAIRRDDPDVVPEVQLAPKSEPGPAAAAAQPELPQRANDRQLPS